MRPQTVGAQDEAGGTYVVEVICLDVIAHGLACLVNHLLRIALHVVPEDRVAVCQIGVQYALQLYAHHV